jgi:hypothetical protein
MTLGPKDTVCPWCGYHHDTVSPVNRDAVPEPGDVIWGTHSSHRLADLSLFTR